MKKSEKNPIFTLIVFVFSFWLLLHWIHPKHQKISDHETISMKELLAAAIDIAEEGGRELVRIKKSGRLKTSEKTGKNDLVTAGDHASHDIMYYGLKGAFPGLAVISEEEDAPQNPSGSVFLPKLTNKKLERILVSDELLPIEDLTVWIDPLDATKEYTEGLTEYVTTMVGFAVDGEAVGGVVHFPFTGETVWGWKEHGNNILDQSENAPRNSVLVSRSHTGQAEEQSKKHLGPNAKIIKAGGAGYKAISIFHGRGEGYFHSGKIKKWDICAIEGIIKSTCYGKFTNLKGQTIDYRF
ncbi:unnamed protein product [Oikopleura dioica]|uniref:inositol-phosphate phosphatase n=1 Tax=Oikopleura dioica TaxID=34765 RepID=E4Y9C6_OIKDI|nr:unnamed protein product [Oikopleura dioica]